MLVTDITRKEMPKYKRTLVIWISIVFPILCSVMTYGVLRNKMPQMLENQQLQANDLWNAVLSSNQVMSMWTLVLIAIVGLIAALIVSMDKDSGTMKIILATPTKRWKFYIQKFIASYSLVTVLLIITNLLLIITGKVLGITQSIPVELVLKNLGIQIVSLMAVCSIQVYLAFYSKNIMTAIGIGAAGALAGLGVLSQAPDIARMFPYSFPYLDKAKNIVPTEAILTMSISMGIILIIVGIRELNKMDIN